MRFTKNISTLLFSGATFLTLALPAFAETTVDPCANRDNAFLKLCDLGQNGDIGATIRNIIIALFVIAALIALFFLIWGGIKWILSGGDKGKVDAARATIVAAIIGLIIVFLAFFILNLVLSFFGLGFGNLTIPTISGIAAPTPTPPGQ